MADTLCGRCNNPVVGRTLTALGRSWHPEHFVCQSCTRPISGPTFNQRDGQPVCSECFLNKYSEICFRCKLPIQEKVIKALGHSWHENHFTCGGPCAKPLSGTPFFTRDGQPYCKQDFEHMFASKCSGCGRAISNKAVVALDQRWHEECFRCKRCLKPIGQSSFAVEDRKPLCNACN